MSDDGSRTNIALLGQCRLMSGLVRDLWRTHGAMRRGGPEAEEKFDEALRALFAAESLDAN